MLKKPDYLQSIVNVPNSILKHYGLPTVNNSLDCLDGLLAKKDWQNVVLMVFDGMGSSVLDTVFKRRGFLQSKKLRDISSVYPCTTASALTSVETGLQPIEHAWLGWSCYFKSEDKNIDLFTSTDSYLRPKVAVADYHVPKSQIGYTSIFETIQKSGTDVYTVSPFGTVFAPDLDCVIEKINVLCAQKEKKFIYAYCEQPDMTLHINGVQSPEAAEYLNVLDGKIETMCSGLENTLVIITADHGMRDIKPMYFLDDLPLLAASLKRRPCQEPRCISFYVGDGHYEAFPEIFNSRFGESFMLLTREKALESKLFGFGAPHPYAYGLLGDYIAVAVSDEALWYRFSNGRGYEFKAAHAGLTADEMTVPLIAVCCGNFSC